MAQVLNYLKENIRDTSTYVSQGVVVHYTFQKETDSTPNIFELPPHITFEKPITVSDILASFPIKFEEKSYHFRFLALCSQKDSNQKAWIDIVNLNAKAPVINKSIFMKILEVPRASCSKIFGKKDQSQAGQQPPRVEHKPPGINVSAAQPRDMAEEKHSASAKLPHSPVAHKIGEHSPQPSHPGKSQSLLGDDWDSMPKSQSKPITPTNPQGDLFSFDAEPAKPAQKAQAAVPKKGGGDLFEFGNEVNPDAQKKFDPTYISPEEKAALAKKMEDKLKAYNDGLAAEKADQDARDISAQILEPRILKWAKKGTQRNNIRALICSLHEVLWEGCNWAPCSIADLGTDNEVKKLFQKAIREVHPDKNQSRTRDQRYIAERVFYELNEANREFRGGK